MKIFRKIFALLTILSVCKLVSAQSEDTNVYLLHHHHWSAEDEGGLTKMLKADDYNEYSNRHYHWKGYVNTNMMQGSVFCFMRKNVRYIHLDGVELPMDHFFDDPNIDYTVSENEVYTLTGGHEHNSRMCLPRTDKYSKDEVPYPAAMLEFDLWCDRYDGGPGRFKVRRIPNPQLFIMGLGKEGGWKNEDELSDDPNHWLSETEEGSMIFQGIVTVPSTNVDDRTFALFPPRYVHDAGYQRLGARSGGEFGALWDDEWQVQRVCDTYTLDSKEDPNYAELYGWKFISSPGKKYLLTVDLRNSNPRSGETTDVNRVKALEATQQVKVGSDLWTTYAPRYNVSTDFSTEEAADAKVTLQYVTGRKNESSNVLAMNTINTSSTTTLQKSEGILLNADKPTTVTFSLTLEEATPLPDNKLVGVTTPTPRIEKEDVYLLGNKEYGVGFYKWPKDVPDNDVPAYKCYLDFDALGAGSLLPVFFSFGEGIETAIGTISSEYNGLHTYNLSGQRINRVQRGVNIVNGKKVMF